MAIKRGLVNRPPRTPTGEFNPPRPTRKTQKPKDGEAVRIMRKR